MKEIPLKSGGSAIVDDVYYRVLSRFKWHSSGSGKNKYAQTSNNGKPILMHRVICRHPRGKVIHHKNGNGLDNRVCNLCACTQGQHRHYHRKYPRGFVKVSSTLTESFYAKFRAAYTSKGFKSDNSALAHCIRQYLANRIKEK